MRSLKITIPFLRKRSKVIPIKNNEETLVVCLNEFTTKGYTVVLCTEDRKRKRLNYLSFCEKMESSISVKNYQFFRIERTSVGLKCELTANIN